jgi:hypothetical protein
MLLKEVAEIVVSTGVDPRVEYHSGMQKRKPLEEMVWEYRLLNTIAMK